MHKISARHWLNYMTSFWQFSPLTLLILLAKTIEYKESEQPFVQFGSNLELKFAELFVIGPKKTSFTID